MRFFNWTRCQLMCIFKLYSIHHNRKMHWKDLRNVQKNLQQVWTRKITEKANQNINKKQRHFTNWQHFQKFPKNTDFLKEKGKTTLAHHCISLNQQLILMKLLLQYKNIWWSLNFHKRLRFAYKKPERKLLWTIIWSMLITIDAQKVKEK